MHKRSILSCLFLITLAHIAGGQNITLSGKITDAATSESLEFASIGLKGKSIGTVSNLQGEFDFHFSEEFRNDILVVSMLGYKNYEVPVWSFTALTGLEIKMEKSMTVLQEVVVKDSLTGGDILRIALARIDENFTQEPFLLDAFYRDIKKIGGNYISLLEAAVQIYDDDNREPRNKHKLKERVKLLELRQSLGYESKFTGYFDQDNLLEDLLLNNNIRYRQIDAREELFSVMKREVNSYYGGHEIFVVSYTGEYMVKLFIDKQDYSIVRLDYKAGGSDDIVDKRKGMVSRFVGIEKTIEFKKFNNKMYLHFIKMTSKINWYDSKTNVLKFESELFQHLLINKINPTPTERIASTESMKRYGLQYQNYKYNKDFWNAYNVIKRTPLDLQIIADLEKSGPLEKQFEDN
jgi:CarboxypepD_reg-like domain